MNGVNGCLWHAGFSGKWMVRWSQDCKIPVKGKGKEAGSGWGGGAGASELDAPDRSPSRSSKQRLPISQILDWTEMARLLYHNLALALGGCYPEMRMTCLKAAS